MAKKGRSAGFASWKLLNVDDDQIVEREVADGKPYSRKGK